jgi:hypothetical protein
MAREQTGLIHLSIPEASIPSASEDDAEQAPFSGSSAG